MKSFFREKWDQVHTISKNDLKMFKEGLDISWLRFINIIENSKSLVNYNKDIDRINLYKFKKEFWKELTTWNTLEILSHYWEGDIINYEDLAFTKKLFWEELSIEKLLFICEKNDWLGYHSFNWLNHAKEKFWKELNIDKVIKILSIQPNLEIFYYISNLTNYYWELITIDKIISILESNPKIDLDNLRKIQVLQNENDQIDIDKDIIYNKSINQSNLWDLGEVKQMYWNDLSKEKVIKILELNPNFNFRPLVELKETFWYEITIDKVISLLEINNSFPFKLLVWLWKIEPILSYCLEYIKEISEYHTYFEITSVNSDFLKQIKYIFKTNYSNKKIIELLKTSPTLNFDLLYEIWTIEPDFDKALIYLDKISKINYNFKFSDFIASRKIFGKNFTLDKLINLLEKNKNFDFKDLTKTWEITSNLELALNFKNITKVIKTWPDKKKLNIFFEDPALKNLWKILDLWELSNYSMEIKMIIARNLFFNDLEVTTENINKEYKRYDEKIKDVKISNIQIFKWRNIIFTAHNENVDEDDIKKYNIKDKEKFWKKVSIESIKKHWGKIAKIYHPEDKQKALKDARMDTLNALETTDYPMTFIFDWHWWPDWLYLSDWDFIWSDKQTISEKNDTIKISVQDIANSLISRSKNKENLNNDKDILIFSSCFNHTFIRKLYKILNNYNKKIIENWSNDKLVKLPITIWESEYNQFWYSNDVNTYWSKFFEKWLGLGNTDEEITVWNINKNQWKLKISNISIFIPDENNIQMQIWSRLDEIEKDFIV